LGQTAAGAVLSAIKLWPELFNKDQGGKMKDEVKAKPAKNIKSAKPKASKKQ